MELQHTAEIPAGFPNAGPEDISSTWKGSTAMEELSAACLCCDLAGDPGKGHIPVECKETGLQSLLGAGKLLVTYDSSGFCVWWTDDAPRQRLQTDSRLALGPSRAAAGARPAPQRARGTAQVPPGLMRGGLGTYSSLGSVPQSSVRADFIPFLGCRRWNKRKALHQMQNGYELLIGK